MSSKFRIVEHTRPDHEGNQLTWYTVDEQRRSLFGFRRWYKTTTLVVGSWGGAYSVTMRWDTYADAEAWVVAECERRRKIKAAITGKLIVNEVECKDA